MKLLTIASSLVAYFYSGIAVASCGPKPGQTPCYNMDVPEPSIIGLISLGVVAVFVASRFKK